MNTQTLRPARVASDARFFLATDLDGTFLGGTPSARERLYNLIEANRDTIGLIFVTGRDPIFIAELCDDFGVPVPEYVIGDVGTTIAKVEADAIVPIPELEEQIAERWANGGDRIREELDGVPGLTLQPTEFRFRVSYDIDPERLAPGIKARMADLGYDVLISDNRYLDVLPRGVSKGPSLQRLVNWLGADPKSVLAAGDTLNDYSMLALGVPAVAVGGSEKALIDALKGHDHVHHAEGVGAAGIVEAIQAFDLHPVHA